MTKRLTGLHDTNNGCVDLRKEHNSYTPLGYTITFIRILFFFQSRLNILIIYKIFSLARDWCKHATWPNIPSQNGGLSH